MPEAAPIPPSPPTPAPSMPDAAPRPDAPKPGQRYVPELGKWLAARLAALKVFVPRDRPEPPPVPTSPAAPVRPDIRPDTQPAPIAPTPDDARRFTERQWKAAVDSPLLTPRDPTLTPDTPPLPMPQPEARIVPQFPMKRLHDHGPPHAEEVVRTPALASTLAAMEAPSGGALSNGDSQARLNALELIRQRLAAVEPFCYPDEARRRRLRGTALLRFQVGAEGYPSVMQLMTSTGHALLDAKIEEMLHLAEPYPFVPGWIVVPITFPPEAATP